MDPAVSFHESNIKEFQHQSSKWAFVQVWHLVCSWICVTFLSFHRLKVKRMSLGFRIVFQLQCCLANLRDYFMYRHPFIPPTSLYVLCADTVPHSYQTLVHKCQALFIVFLLFNVHSYLSTSSFYNPEYVLIKIIIILLVIIIYIDCVLTAAICVPAEYNQQVYHTLVIT